MYEEDISVKALRGIVKFVSVTLDYHVAICEWSLSYSTFQALVYHIILMLVNIFFRLRCSDDIRRRIIHVEDRNHSIVESVVFGMLTGFRSIAACRASSLLPLVSSELSECWSRVFPVEMYKSRRLMVILCCGVPMLLGQIVATKFSLGLFFFSVTLLLTEMLRRKDHSFEPLFSSGGSLSMHISSVVTTCLTLLYQHSEFSLKSIEGQFHMTGWLWLLFVFSYLFLRWFELEVLDICARGESFALSLSAEDFIFSLSSSFMLSCMFSLVGLNVYGESFSDAIACIFLLPALHVMNFFLVRAKRRVAPQVAFQELENFTKKVEQNPEEEIPQIIGRRNHHSGFINGEELEIFEIKNSETEVSEMAPDNDTGIKNMMVKYLMKKRPKSPSRMDYDAGQQPRVVGGVIYGSVPAAIPDI